MGYLDLYIEAKERRRGNTEGKPLAGYSFTKSQEYYSGLFEESYRFEGDEIVFGSGVTYSAAELETLRSLDNETKKTLHEFKKVLGGEIKEAKA